MLYKKIHSQCYDSFSVLSMSINHEDESIFIMGTEGGGVIQGSFNSLIPVSCKSNILC